MTAEEINGLKDYLGSTPKPVDFEIFWKERMEEADAVPLEYTICQAKEVPSFAQTQFLDLWFKGMNGADIYGKFLRPKSVGTRTLSTAISWLSGSFPQLGRAGKFSWHGNGTSCHGLSGAGRAWNGCRRIPWNDSGWPYCDRSGRS